MNRFARSVDALSEWSGRFSAWMFFTIGLFITYEVVMRYVFTAPTVWVDEVSRVMQIWAAYLGAAYVLKHRKMITIEVILKDPSSIRRRMADTLAIIMLLVFVVPAVYFGFQLWLKSTLAGHTTDSFLGSPKWLTHASVWIGLGLLALQSIVELYRVWFAGIQPGDYDQIADSH